MAAKTKRMSRKELRQQDEVMTSLQRLYAGLRTYRKHLIVGAGAVVVLLLAASAISSWRDSARKDRAAAFAEAFGTLQAPVGDEVAGNALLGIEEPAGTERFDTEEAKYAAAATRLEAFAQAHDGAGIGAVATLGFSAALAEQKKWADARSALEQARKAESTDSLAPILGGQAATLALAEKQAAAAKSDLEQLAQSDSPYFKALAKMRLADLANPSYPAGDEAGKSASGAKDSYEAALAALTAGDRELVGFERSLKEDIEHKLSLLGTL